MADMYDLAKHTMAGHSEHEHPKVIKHIITRKVHGGHVHEHVHTHPESHPNEEHVTQGDDAMVSHMLENSGTPNPGEADADAGQSGIPPTAGPNAATASPLATATSGAQTA